MCVNKVTGEYTVCVLCQVLYGPTKFNSYYILSFKYLEVTLAPFSVDITREIDGQQA